MSSPIGNNTTIKTDNFATNAPQQVKDKGTFANFRCGFLNTSKKVSASNTANQGATRHAVSATSQTKPKLKANETYFSSEHIPECESFIKRDYSQAFEIAPNNKMQTNRAVSATFQTKSKVNHSPKSEAENKINTSSSFNEIKANRTTPFPDFSPANKSPEANDEPKISYKLPSLAPAPKTPFNNKTRNSKKHKQFITEYQNIILNSLKTNLKYDNKVTEIKAHHDIYTELSTGKADALIELLHFLTADKKNITISEIEVVSGRKVGACNYEDEKVLYVNFNITTKEGKQLDIMHYFPLSEIINENPQYCLVNFLLMVNCAFKMTALQLKLPGIKDGSTGVYMEDFNPWYGQIKVKGTMHTGGMATYEYVIPLHIILDLKSDKICLKKAVGNTELDLYTFIDLISIEQQLENTNTDCEFNSDSDSDGACNFECDGIDESQVVPIGNQLFAVAGKNEYKDEDTEVDCDYYDIITGFAEG